jgi:hypothetical protein
MTNNYSYSRCSVPHVEVVSCETILGKISNAGASPQVSRTTVKFLSLEICPGVSVSNLVSGVLLMLKLMVIIICF